MDDCERVNLLLVGVNKKRLATDCPYMYIAEGQQCQSYYSNIFYDVGACRNPKVESKSYTTSDVLLSTETAFIVEVKVQCDDVSITACCPQESVNKKNNRLIHIMFFVVSPCSFITH